VFAQGGSGRRVGQLPVAGRGRQCSGSVVQPAVGGQRRTPPCRSAGPSGRVKTGRTTSVTMTGNARHGPRVLDRLGGQRPSPLGDEAVLHEVPETPRDSQQRTPAQVCRSRVGTDHEPRFRGGQKASSVSPLRTPEIRRGSPSPCRTHAPRRRSTPASQSAGEHGQPQRRGGGTVHHQRGSGLPRTVRHARKFFVPSQRVDQPSQSDRDGAARSSPASGPRRVVASRFTYRSSTAKSASVTGLRAGFGLL